MSDKDVRFDWQRADRTGVPEVVFAQGKSASQLQQITASALQRGERVLMTRIDPSDAATLIDAFAHQVCWHEPSSTLSVNATRQKPEAALVHPVAIVAAGSSDYYLVSEIEQCLQFLGVSCRCYLDVGVAGLWRLTDLADELNSYSVLIAVAGMEGAMFSVLAGLVSAPVIAVPSTIGYGVSSGGEAALTAALSSCAPGIAVVNIDNGFGAAALAAKILNISSAVQKTDT
jgi:NCAIR mutase (PurE)-related protein